MDLLGGNRDAAFQSLMSTRTPEPGSTNPSFLAYLALVAAILCIAWSAIFVRWTDIPGSVSAFYRMLIPAVILLPTFFFDKNHKPLSRRSVGIIALGGIFFAGDLALYNSSILRTTAANATLLGNNSPIFVGLLTWLLLRRRPQTSFWFGLVLAMGGSLVILRSDSCAIHNLDWAMRWRWEQQDSLPCIYWRPKKCGRRPERCNSCDWQ